MTLGKGKENTDFCQSSFTVDANPTQTDTMNNTKCAKEARGRAAAQ